MDEKKNTQTSSTKTPVSINAMSKMMAMQASLPELIYNLKLMGVNVGGSIINPFVAMTFVQAIETAVEKVLDDGWRTGDIAGAKLAEVKAAGKLVGTKKMGELVVEALN